MGEKDGAEARALWHSSQGLLASWDVCVCVCVCVWLTIYQVRDPIRMLMLLSGFRPH